MVGNASNRDKYLLLENCYLRNKRGKQSWQQSRFGVNLQTIKKFLYVYKLYIIIYAFDTIFSGGFVGFYAEFEIY